MSLIADRVSLLRRRLATLLAVESGANDPMAVALTLGLIAWVEHSDYGVDDFALLLARQFVLGLIVGIVLGVIASKLLRRLPTDLAPFASVASIGTAALAYGVAASLDGSGFLAVYLVGLWVGNTPMPLRRTIVIFHEGLAFLAQVVLFIVLGLLVFPSQLPDGIFNAVFFVVLVSTLAQGMTLEPFARRLGLATEGQPYDRRAK